MGDSSCQLLGLPDLGPKSTAMNAFKVQFDQYQNSKIGLNKDP